MASTRNLEIVVTPGDGDVQAAARTKLDDFAALVDANKAVIPPLLTAYMRGAANAGEAVRMRSDGTSADVDQRANIVNATDGKATSPFVGTGLDTEVSAQLDAYVAAAATTPGAAVLTASTIARIKAELRRAPGPGLEVIDYLVVTHGGPGLSLRVRRRVRVAP